MEKSAQKVFDRADIVRDVRLPLPAQAVDATPPCDIDSTMLPQENNPVWLYSVKT
jgi:hypothetical protein